MLSLDVVIPACNADRMIDATLAAVLRQHSPVSLDTGIVVVNNDSTDDTAARVDAWSDAGVRRIDHIAIRSRAAARNAGAARSSAEFLLFIDADCRLVGDDNLQAISAAISNDVAAGFGFATGAGESFWARYYRDLERRRKVDDWRGWTTQLFFVRRDLFVAAGGFSEAYTHYGFEDRDFFCRLKRTSGNAKLQLIRSLRAHHDTDTSMVEICEKAYESGRFSSGIFKRDFKSDYATLPYARVDADTGSRPVIALLRLLGPLERAVILLTDLLTRNTRAPLFLARPLVLLSTALSYCRGTRDRDAQARLQG
jgi:glycosyltransferase involved in cell wall biosynthesis